MAGCYTDSYALPEDEAPLQQPRPAAAASKAAAPSSLLLHATAAPSAAEPPPPAAAGEEELGQPSPAHPLLYVRSPRLTALSQLCPVNKARAELVHSLVAATGLLEAADVAEPPPATIEQLREYHSLEYLAALAHFQKLKEGQRAAAGLEDDCVPFPGVYEYAALLAGGSLAAAEALAARRHRIAVHFDGGRHHAHKSKAAGFCYVNDVVLAILRLLGSFQRVMYVDVDIHHCDAVQEAFNMTDRVLTVSLHKWAPGFFPGTGSMRSIGEGVGRGFSLNLPLEDGLRDELLAEAFSQLAGGAVQRYKPDCVVLQCGVDGLAHDPLAGHWGLTPRGYAACAAEAARWGVPLLVLGGGGYNDAAAARAWAAVLAALLGQELPDEVPDHEHLDKYGPNYQVFTASKPMLKPDGNSREGVAARCRQLLSLLDQALAARSQGRSTEQQAGGVAPKRARAG